MNRLKKLNYHDIKNRSSAILYVNQKFYQANTHAQALNEYLEDNDKDLLYDDFYRFDPTSSPNDYKSNSQKNDIKIINDNVEQMVFAHLVEDKNDIYIETETLFNISLSEAINVFKNEYPSYLIYNDDVQDESGNYEKIAKIKKLSDHDICNRDSAILYINGDIIEGYSHSDALTEYLQDESDRKQRYRVFTDTEKSDQLAFAHKCIEDNAIYIEPDTLRKININTVAMALKERYPNYDIYQDDEDICTNNPEDYKKIAKLKKY